MADVLVNDYVDHFRQRLLQDALAQAIPQQHERRAQEFKRVGTPACDELAQAYRNAATFWEAQWRGETPSAVVCVFCDTPALNNRCSCGRVFFRTAGTREVAC